MTRDFWSLTLSREADVVHKEIESKGVLLNLESGNYYTVNHTGLFVWSLLEHARPLKEILETVQSHFSVEPDRAATDIQTLVETMQAEGLVKLSDGSE